MLVSLILLKLLTCMAPQVEQVSIRCFSALSSSYANMLLGSHPGGYGEQVEEFI